jgi:hypothetical protein
MMFADVQPTVTELGVWVACAVSVAVGLSSVLAIFKFLLGPIHRNQEQMQTEIHKIRGERTHDIDIQAAQWNELTKDIAVLKERTERRK